jgi:hypothetical protein
MQTLKSLLDSPAVNVFLGILPLLGAIVWALLQNERMLRTIDKRMDLIDKRIDGMDQRLGRMETRIDSIDGQLATVSERLVKVETKLEGGQLVLTTR